MEDLEEPKVLRQDTGKTSPEEKDSGGGENKVSIRDSSKPALVFEGITISGTNTEITQQSGR